MIWISLISLFLVTSCSYFDPELYPVENELLKPGPEVKVIGFTEDGDPIVSPAYMDWVERLRQEIKRLRDLLFEKKIDSKIKQK